MIIYCLKHKRALCSFYWKIGVPWPSECKWACDALLSWLWWKWCCGISKASLKRPGAFHNLSSGTLALGALGTVKIPCFTEGPRGYTLTNKPSPAQPMVHPRLSTCLVGCGRFQPLSAEAQTRWIRDKPAPPWPVQIPGPQNSWQE